MNSYILSKSSPFKSFRLQLAKELIGSYCSRKLSGRGSNQRRPLQILHFPLKIGSTTTSVTKHKRDRCELCKKIKQEKIPALGVTSAMCGYAVQVMKKLTAFIIIFLEVDVELEVHVELKVDADMDAKGRRGNFFSNVINLYKKS